MTPEQILLVRSSFAKVGALGDRAAVLFYERLFELDPSSSRCSEATLRSSARI